MIVTSRAAVRVNRTRAVASLSVLVRITRAAVRSTAVTHGKSSGAGSPGEGLHTAMIRLPEVMARMRSTEPSATISPRAMSMIRSAKPSASSMWWVAKMIVDPDDASSCIVAQNSRREAMSIAAVGSSRISRSGSGSRASANRSRCCSPPEHRPTLRRASPASPARSSTSPTLSVSL